MNRIKLQLYAIELCALLLLLCMFVLSFQRVQALAEEKQEIYLENALSQAAQGVERKLADIAASVQNYAYSDAVQYLTFCAVPILLCAIWKKMAMSAQ